MADGAQESAERLSASAQLADDPYLDQLWGILKNRVHARTKAELAQAEHDLVGMRLMELAARPVVGDYDLDHLQAIHRHLFQDVYQFAGELRTVDMRKSDDPSGRFFPAARLQEGGRHVFAELAEDNYLKGMDREQFTDRLAHHLDAINHLHPFREGNGRSQRAFLADLSQRAGYDLVWCEVTQEQNDQASRQGKSALTELLGLVVTKKD